MRVDLSHGTVSETKTSPSSEYITFTSVSLFVVFFASGWFLRAYGSLPRSALHCSKKGMGKKREGERGPCVGCGIGCGCVGSDGFLGGWGSCRSEESWIASRSQVFDSAPSVNRWKYFTLSLTLKLPSSYLVFDAWLLEGLNLLLEGSSGYVRVSCV